MDAVQMDEKMKSGLERARLALLNAQASIMRDCEDFAENVEKSDLPDYIKTSFLDAYMKGLGEIQKDLEA